MNWGQKIIDEIRQTTSRLGEKVNEVNTELKDLQQRLARLEKVTNSRDQPSTPPTPQPDAKTNTSADNLSGQPAQQTSKTSSRQETHEIPAEILEVLTSPKQNPVEKITPEKAAELIRNTPEPVRILWSPRTKDKSIYYINVYHQKGVWVNINYNPKSKWESKLSLSRLTWEKQLYPFPNQMRAAAQLPAILKIAVLYAQAKKRRTK